MQIFALDGYFQWAKVASLLRDQQDVAYEGVEGVAYHLYDKSRHSIVVKSYVELGFDHLEQAFYWRILLIMN